MIPKPRTEADAPWSGVHLFYRGVNYPSRHCRGSATMVVSMTPNCEMAQERDIFGLAPGC